MLILKHLIFKNSNGHALVLVMLFTSIIGITISTFLTTISMQQKQELKNQILVTRMILEYRIQNSITSLGHLDATLKFASNTAFKNCVSPSGNSCVETSSSGFKLIDPFANTAITGTGTGAASVRYDTLGNICTTASESCPFEVYTIYIATCAPAASPCSSPIVTMGYGIRMADNISANTGLHLKEYTANGINIPTGAASGTLTPMYQCTNKSFVTGINSDGTIQCSSFDGTKKCTNPSDCTASAPIAGTPCTANFVGHGGTNTGITFRAGTGGAYGLSTNKACCILAPGGTGPYHHLPICVSY